MEKIQTIAFYLPQFYPTPENDNWWGKGFTEWTNVGRAKPIFKGHVQPKVPTELGYYDLRLPEVRELQANLAKEHGIHGFCYWHYWFAGKRLLDKVFSEVLESRHPNFPFCLCWANHSWYAKTWDPKKKGQNKLLIEQTYPGIEDYKAHFYAMLPAFKDSRYMRTNKSGKLIFGIFDPLSLPNPKEFMTCWNQLAQKEGLPEFHFFGYVYFFETRNKAIELGYDSVAMDYLYFGKRQDTTIVQYFLRELFNIPPKLSSYKKYVDFLKKDFKPSDKIMPCLLPNFDHSPRSGKYGRILKGSTPALWENLLENTISKLLEKSDKNNEKILFIKAWNEWGEGNYLEPDLQYGREYLIKLKTVLTKYNQL